jgi:hypothetical protein
VSTVVNLVIQFSKIEHISITRIVLRSRIAHELHIGQGVTPTARLVDINEEEITSVGGCNSLLQFDPTRTQWRV